MRQIVSVMALNARLEGILDVRNMFGVGASGLLSGVGAATES